MEYQKMINLLNNRPNQPTKFRKKIWLKEMMNHVESITLIVKLFKTSMLRTSFCDENNGGEESNIQVVFKYCTPFTDCIIEIKTIQIDNGK